LRPARSGLVKIKYIKSETQLPAQHHLVKIGIVLHKVEDVAIVQTGAEMSSPETGAHLRRYA